MHETARNKKAPYLTRRRLGILDNEVAERVGFEPTHAVRRLADFESAPLDHLGTFPFPQRRLLYHGL